MSPSRPSPSERVTVCVLCYGDHPDLARRSIGSILHHTDQDAFNLRIGLNAGGVRTEEFVDEVVARFPETLVVRSGQNIFKAPMLGRLIGEPAPATPWTVWFDDDSFVRRSDWLPLLRNQIALHPSVDMWGSVHLVRCGQDLQEFVDQSAWYRGLPFVIDQKTGDPVIRFAVGGYWAIKTEWFHRLKWPDARIRQYGEDYMLGEALRQNGGAVGDFLSGIAINRAVRRIPSSVRVPGFLF